MYWRKRNGKLRHALKKNDFEGTRGAGESIAIYANSTVLRSGNSIAQGIRRFPLDLHPSKLQKWSHPRLQF